MCVLWKFLPWNAPEWVQTKWMCCMCFHVSHFLIFFLFVMPVCLAYCSLLDSWEIYFPTHTPHTQYPSYKSEGDSVKEEQWAKKNMYMTYSLWWNIKDISNQSIEGVNFFFYDVQSPSLMLVYIPLCR